ncbi:hypothetical protein [Campylobacter sp. JMF_08 NE1]|nr:hypothetical protein [Campylobacter sp. JMF_08 NE1]MDA3048575.1 hypothetical protein [Campylobacter sp. JMF_08 NE1]
MRSLLGGVCAVVLGLCSVLFWLFGLVVVFGDLCLCGLKAFKGV